MYECFRTTLARTKKAVRAVGTSSESKGAVEEFEALMERIHSQANGEEVGPEGAEGEGMLGMGEVKQALEALDADEDGEGTAGEWRLLRLY